MLDKIQCPIINDSAYSHTHYNTVTCSIVIGFLPQDTSVCQRIENVSEVDFGDIFGFKVPLVSKFFCHFAMKIFQMLQYVNLWMIMIPLLHLNQDH